MDLLLLRGATSRYFTSGNWWWAGGSDRVGLKGADGHHSTCRTNRMGFDSVTSASQRPV